MVEEQGLPHSSDYQLYMNMCNKEPEEPQVYLSELYSIEQDATVQAAIQQMATYYENKHYYELSTAAFQHLKRPNMHYLEKMTFFKSVISPLYLNISPIQFVTTLSEAAHYAEADIALLFLETYDHKVNRLNDSDASMIYTASQAYHHARIKKNTSVSEALLDKIYDKMEFDMNLHLLVNTSFHRAKMQLSLATEKHAEYCKNATLFFMYTPLDQIPEDEKLEIALQLVTFAIVAENMYDFGDILQLPPVSNNLINSEFQWIVQFLHIFDNGDVIKYTDMVNTHNYYFEKRDLLKYSSQMKNKITTLALMNFAFHKPKNERVISFDQIANHCQVDILDVEKLVMTAMSNKLIKGNIDEVNKVVTVTWVKPRILDAQRLDLMKKRIENWAASAQQLQNHLENITQELLS